MQNFVISIKQKNRLNASSKAKNDLREFMLERGYQALDLAVDIHGGKVSKLYWAGIILPNILRKAFKDGVGTVVIQYPLYSVFLEDALYRALRRYKLNLVYVIHDLETLRLYKGNLSKQEHEFSLLRKADMLVAPTKRMQEYLKGELGLSDSQVVYNLMLFDYKNDHPYPVFKQYDRSVCFAGNLDKSKFLQDGNCPKLALYGCGYKVKLPQLSYKGSFGSDEVAGKLTENYGLVWDGSKLDTCGGNIYGDYLAFNAPHKLSMYLSSGLPVIVWRKSAMADYVQSSGVGILVDRIDNLAERLAKIDEDQYLAMRDRAIIAGQRLRNGMQTWMVLSQIEDRYRERVSLPNTGVMQASKQG